MCERAAAYQNAYSLAAEQILPSGENKFPRRQQFPATGRTNHVRLEPGTTGKPKSRCFCCEGEHREMACPIFKEMPTKEKVRFCVKRRLCMKCFGTRHSAADCTFGKGCGAHGCPYIHDITHCFTMPERSTTKVAAITHHFQPRWIVSRWR